MGKTVEVVAGEVTVNGVARPLDWGDAKHSDCKGKIVSVDPAFKGKVKLDDGTEFEIPASGRVSLDGTDLRSLNVKWLRSQIGLVSQVPCLLRQMLDWRTPVMHELLSAVST